MTNMKATKRALLSSVIALFLCFAMLLGTTYAWFTDSATSAGNTITTGTLDVELYRWTFDDTTGAVVATGLSELAKNDPTADTSVFNADVIWEPGHTEVAYLSIKNNGSLALKYRVAVIATLGADVDGDKADITEVMLYEITTDKRFGEVTSWDGALAKGVNTGTNVTADDVTLMPGDEHFFALSVHMMESAGNKFQNETVVFDIQVLAAQLASESDSFGTNYDVNAGYEGVGVAVVNENGYTSVETRDELGYKVASAEVPNEAVADGVDKIKLVVAKKDEADFTIANGMDFAAYDVSIEGLVEGNTAPIKVNLKAPVGLNPDTVTLYHKGALVADATYNPNTGYVTFETTGFSPFAIVYDADDKYDAPDAEGITAPSAIVEYLGVNAGLDTIEWESYGSWSPTEGLDSTLEATFKFSCPTLTDEQREAYEYWYCDFYVSLDKALGANQIFLGGNYGDFGWIGFHNGDLTLAANEEIGLLKSVTTNPWTYADIENFVGNFICGVGDVNDALNGATFTVKLRLTNPADEAEFYDVNVVTYTFGGDYTIQ